MYNKSLAFTGGGLVIGSTVLDQTVLIAVAFGVIVAGALAIRFGFRRGRTAEDR